jgi:3-hydroxyacyl-[acyl-carrier-protein] dehydratase
MRFQLVDRILEIVPKKRILATKNLTLGEEYLADHFPTFPVMPGVLMLEALIQAGAWLLRVSEDFCNSVTVLREVKGVKYGSFVEPGAQLGLTVEIIEARAQESKPVMFKGSGDIRGTVAVSGKFGLQSYSLGSTNPSLESIDRRLTAEYRELYKLLYRPTG